MTKSLSLSLSVVLLAVNTVSADVESPFFQVGFYRGSSTDWISLTSGDNGGDVPLMGYYLRDATSLSFSYSPAVPGHLLFAIAIDAGGDFGGGIWSCDLDYKSGVNSSDFISKDGVHRDGWTTAHLQEGKEGIFLRNALDSLITDGVTWMRTSLGNAGEGEASEWTYAELEIGEDGAWTVNIDLTGYDFTSTEAGIILQFGNDANNPHQFGNDANNPHPTPEPATLLILGLGLAGLGLARRRK